MVALAALRNLAGTSDGEVAVAAGGGIEAILEALRVHGGSAATQEVGLEALARVMHTHPAIQARRAHAPTYSVLTPLAAMGVPGGSP